MPVHVVDALEVVQVCEEHGVQALGPLGTRFELRQAVLQQGSVRQPGQRVVQGVVLEALGLPIGLLARVRVQQERRSHIGEGLCGEELRVGELARNAAVQVQGSEPAVAVPQREREHRRQAVRGGGGAEQRVPRVLADVEDDDRASRGERRQARSLIELALELFEQQRSVVRSRDVPRRRL